MLVGHGADAAVGVEVHGNLARVILRTPGGNESEVLGEGLDLVAGLVEHCSGAVAALKRPALELLVFGGSGERALGGNEVTVNEGGLLVVHGARAAVGVEVHGDAVLLGGLPLGVEGELAGEVAVGLAGLEADTVLASGRGRPAQERAALGRGERALGDGDVAVGDGDVDVVHSARAAVGVEAHGNRVLLSRLPLGVEGEVGVEVLEDRAGQIGAAVDAVGRARPAHELPAIGMREGALGNIVGAGHERGGVVLHIIRAVVGDEGHREVAALVGAVVLALGLDLLICLSLRGDRLVVVGKRRRGRIHRGGGHEGAAGDQRCGSERHTGGEPTRIRVTCHSIIPFVPHGTLPRGD